MPEHYPKSTVEVTVWCNPCGKITRHSVFDGRRGACLDCIAKREQQAKARPMKPPAAEQGRLF